MFKRGICYPRELKSLRGISARRPISYRLLRLALSANEEDVKAFEAIVGNIQLSCGICRTTYRGRLLDVDRWASAHIHALRDAKRCLEVHDWAASDALASSEWAKSLLQDELSCQFTASDATLYLVEVSKGGKDAYIFEPNGAPLQYVHPPFVILFNRTDSGIFLANRLLRFWAARRVRAFRTKVLSYRWKSLDDPSEIFDGPVMIRLLPLVHPEALALQRQTTNFRIGVHSVLSPLKNPVDVIRTMNIYNTRYFSDGELAQGFSAVFQSLAIGGLWIVGRTFYDGTTPRSAVSILKKSYNGFRLLDRMNGGFELEQALERLGYFGNSGKACSPTTRFVGEQSLHRTRVP